MPLVLFCHVLIFFLFIDTNKLTASHSLWWANLPFLLQNMPLGFTGLVYKLLINNLARFDSTVEGNAKLDIGVKKAILKASPSVVCLISYTGDTRLSICSGVIMECEGGLDDTFVGTVLTSATLLQCPNGADKVANDLKIEVIILSGEVFEGQLLAFDFHHNIAAIQIKSSTPLSTAAVRYIDESIAIDMGKSCPMKEPIVESRSFRLVPHRDTSSSSSRFTLCPGELVLALGRHFEDPFDVMAAPGEFSSDDCKFECRELHKARCKIKKNGIGGPLINRYGEVIGINFYDPLYTPFLPINIASKCFEHLKKYRQVPRPWLGLDVTDLHTVTLYFLEELKSKFPSVVRGAIIHEVQRGSPAKVAGLCVDDVIIRCGGNSVGSCLELSEMLWDKEGKPVELVVVRPSTGEELNLIVATVKTSPKQHRWPVPEERVMRIPLC